MKIGSSKDLRKTTIATRISVRECCSKMGDSRFCSSCGRPASHTPKLYGSDKIIDSRLFVKGEFRRPKKGEYFLSGALPTAHEAFNDMSEKYYVAVQVDLV